MSSSLARVCCLLAGLAAIGNEAGCECAAPLAGGGCVVDDDCPPPLRCELAACVKPTFDDDPVGEGVGEGEAGVEGEGEGEAGVEGEGEGEGEGEAAGEGEGEAAGDGEGEAAGEGEGNGEGEGEGETPPTFDSCRALHAADPSAPSGVTRLVIDSVAVDVECDMTTAGGGWSLMTRFEEGDPCPAGWTPEPRGCGRASANVASTSFSAPHPFSEVRGRVRGLGLGGSDGFRDQGGSVDGLYLDGVAITIGAAPRRHVHAFAVGVGDAFGSSFVGSECPCAGGPAPPAFVGSAYACEEPRTPVVDNNVRVYDNADVLWDGLDIDTRSCASAPESAPDFSASVGAVTSEALEVHIMLSQAPGDENVAVIGLELWVR